jgi:hypothetical protein
MTKSTERHPASQALIDLRKALGKMTQQDFAVKVLECATTTISRYESFGPPKGDALLKLRAIALKHDLVQIAKRFQDLWLEEVNRTLGPGVRTYVMERGSGLLVASLPDKEAIEFAEIFLAVLDQLDSKDKDEKFRQNALSILSSTREAVRRFDPPGTHDLRDGLREGFAKLGAKVTFTKGH